MGLDMYMMGEYRDGDREKELELGYWRGGRVPAHRPQRQRTSPRCSRAVSGACADQLKQVLEAVRNPHNLPVTTGFFFGVSCMNEEEVADDVRQLESAIKWLEEDPSRRVFYQASW